MSKYTALHITATVYQVGGAILAALTVIGSMGMCLFGTYGTNLEGPQEEATLVYGLFSIVFLSMVVLVAGSILALIAYANGEQVSLLLDLSEKTDHIVEGLKEK